MLSGGFHSSGPFSAHPERVLVSVFGIAVGSAIFGYYLGLYLRKKKNRINHLIKLSTGKVGIF